MMKNHNMSLLALLLSGMLALTACGDGSDGADGVNGTDGADGADGADGTDGLNAGDVVSTIYQAGDVTFTIDPAENTLAGDNTFALTFSVTAKNQAGADKPLTGLSQIAIYSVTAMTNTTDDGPSVYWENNAETAAGAHSMYCTLDGTYTSRGTTGEACTLVEDSSNPGTYTGTWTYTDTTAPIMNADDDLTAPHRIFIRAYNLTDEDGNSISDKVLSTPLDYIPSTGETVDTTGKDTVADAACKQCHGESDSTGNIANISAHGNYESVKNCIACHNPATQPDDDAAAEGYVFDLPAMIHRIHGGEHLAELADYGFLQTDEWSEIAYPAPLRECTVCHSTDDGMTTWKDEPTRAACGGCHSNIDFSTGEGHASYNLAQADDSQCSSCHGSGGLAPETAHSVGKRAEASALMTVTFTGASKVAAATEGYQDVTVTATVTFNGAALADVTDLDVLSKASTLMGNVDSNGEVTRWSSRPDLTSGTLTDGVLSLTQEVTDAQATGTIYVGTEANFCVSSDEEIVACGDDDTDYMFDDEDPVGASSTVAFFDLDGGDAVTARFADDDRITVSEAKCNACHSSLDYIKGSRHGVYTFDQCMDCHNNNYAGSYHADAVYADEDGNEVATGITYLNRDLVTVAHRFHSGNFDSTSGIYKDADGDVVGYPGVQGDCTACHKDGATLFADDGGLTSGKRSIAITGGYYISPVAESCRSCHSSESALAHFKSNGAVTADDLNTDSDLSIESCATCHAEGKTYGIDTVHPKF